MRKIKIVIATPLFPPEIGEPAPYVYELAKRLCKKLNITVVTYANHTEPLEGIRVKTVSKNQHTLLRLYRYTRTLIDSTRNADAIYLQKGVSSGLPALIASLITKTPLVFNYSEDEAWERLSYPYPSEHQGRFRKAQKVPGAIWFIWHIQRLMLTRAKTVITPSDFLGEELVRTHDLKKASVVTNYLPQKALVKLPFSPQKKKYHIFVDAPLLEWKDVATAIRAVALLKNSYPDITLAIAGEGPDRQTLEELIQERSLEKNVTLLGKISTAECQYRLQGASLFFSPAMYEDRPNTAFKAMELGIPVAVTDVPGQREQLTDKVDALLVPPGNALAASDMFSELFEDKKLQETLTKNAKCLFEKSFSWEAHIKKLETVFSTYTYEQRK